MRKSILSSYLTFSLMASACSLSNAENNNEYKTLESNYSNVIVRVVAVGEVPDEHLKTAVEAVSSQGQQLVKNLNSQPLPQSSIFVWEDRDAFESAYGEKNNFTRGFIQTDDWEVHVYYTNRSPAMSALHEYAHLVLYSLRPTMASEARWLWETIPIYISNRPPAPDLASLKCLGRSSAPSLQDLNEHGSNIYRVGFYLGDFLVKKWGWEGLEKLVRNGADVRKAFGIDETQFQNAWLDHLGAGDQEDFSTDC